MAWKDTNKQYADGDGADGEVAEQYPMDAPADDDATGDATDLEEAADDLEEAAEHLKGMADDLEAAAEELREQAETEGA